MNLDLTEQQQMLKEAARTFLEKECPLTLVRELEKNGQGISREHWLKLASMGWLGLLLKESYGGAGFGFTDQIVILEEMGRACFPSPYLETASIAGPIIQTSNKDEPWKKRQLSTLARGEAIWTLAGEEPTGLVRHDVRGVRASHSPSGFRLDGVLSNVPYFPMADFLLCQAEAEDGMRIFAVECHANGISSSPASGTSGQPLHEVKLDNVQVSLQDCVFDTEHAAGFLQKMTLIGAVAKCAETVGMAEKVLEMTVDYAKRRMQFERPIGAFQAVQYHCANMSIDLDACRLITHKACWALDSGEDYGVQASMAKAWASKAAVRLAYLGHQVHGGIGLTMDYDLQLYSRRLLANAAAFGTAALHHNLLGEHLRTQQVDRQQVSQAGLPR